jgi:ankyrin repeat protein
MMAVRGGHLETVKMLVWEVAELDLKNHDGATALQWAIKSQRQDIVAHLKQAGAKE